MSKLSYFMRPELKQDVVMEVPGVETFKDEEGNTIPFKIKRLSTSEQNKIRGMYRTRKMATDKNGKPIISNSNEVVFIEKYDGDRAVDRIIVEAFVEPDLKNKELMDFYGVYDVEDMPKIIFSKTEDYNYVVRSVMKILGLWEKSDGEIIEEVKNS